MDIEFNKSYWKSLSSDEKQKLVDKCNTNKAYMYQVANGHRGAGPDLANNIHAATAGAWPRTKLNKVFIDPLPNKP